MWVGEYSLERAREEREGEGENKSVGETRASVRTRRSEGLTEERPALKEVRKGPCCRTSGGVWVF